MNTPDGQTLSAVDVSALYGNVFPKQITEREYVLLGKLVGTNAATATFKGLGPNPSTGINPAWKGFGSLGAFSLVSLAGAGGHVAICLDGSVRVRTAAGAQSVVTMAANGAEPALNTVMGVDTDVNGLQAGTIVKGSAFTNTWQVSVTRASKDALTITLKHTTPATDQQWNGDVSVTDIALAGMNVWFGNPAAFGTKHTAVVSSAIDAFASAQTIALDTTAPTVTGFTVPASDTDYVITVSTFTVTEASGDIYRAITMADVAPAADSELWGALGATPATYTIPVSNRAGTGNYTLYGWAKDSSGNVSASVSDTIALTIA